MPATKTRKQIKPRAIGWDRRLQIYRHLTKGEKTRGLIIQNPKKLTKKQIQKLRLKY